eukprot:TRINITY_DN16994_c0_g1_i1.p1 TRINITY_DN16994_c0_g1~~TRINITY_DN16994_c0_g1_i1.p1  ORF type:complete len:110 (+),score=16.76 TRINITY_DN16994_c0_g1_i1:107-436(+)
MIRRPPRSTLSSSSAASDVYKRQQQYVLMWCLVVVSLGDESERDLLLEVAYRLAVVGVVLVPTLRGATQHCLLSPTDTLYAAPEVSLLITHLHCRRLLNSSSTSRHGLW